ncbi:MAG: hypothetical protein COW01_12405 [Bdellovibrionales bacterium CG12_big_fil_rev_8_21_14_0_65_38_15]|nr:MAG: hypothetical protein COW01_12405 [Bdellovibrionales bacterium CG12_big_fil_rev_8_21_14_0_65_38_15]PIR30986.1 MAG: hypothetical protein COV38_02985 [Bdellovibrionales bacterium CG11_big_fil_rev_8_21_14_0_20_38_13]
MICFGMVPLQSPELIGSLMLIPKEFPPFQSPNRTFEDIENFAKLSACGDKTIEKLLIDAVHKQDPNFNSTFFTSGISDYDWNEMEKAKLLDHRFKLILTSNEVVYDFDQASRLDIPIIIDDYKGHSPWLLDSNWLRKFIEI